MAPGREAGAGSLAGRSKSRPLAAVSATRTLLLISSLLPHRRLRLDLRGPGPPHHPQGGEAVEVPLSSAPAVPPPLPSSGAPTPQINGLPPQLILAPLSPNPLCSVLHLQYFAPLLPPLSQQHFLVPQTGTTCPSCSPRHSGQTRSRFAVA